MTDSHLACSSLPVSEALAEAEATCDARGAKLTRVRRKVLELLLERDAPAKAYDLLSKLDGEGAAKPPTVYRALDFLLEMGLVHKIESLNAYIACGHRGHSHSAVFLICKNCEAALELHSEKTGEALVQDTQDIGFEMTRAVIEVTGICERCA